MHTVKFWFTPIVIVLLMMGSPLFLSNAFALDIQSNTLMEETVKAPYLQKNTKRFQLVFFGYVGCKTVCTPMLHQLSSLYDSPSFARLKPFVGVSFVNLIPEMDANLPQAYARSINPNFVGIHLDQKELASIDKEFSVFIAKRLNDPSEIDHSDHIYLIERDKKGNLLLKNIYITHPLNKEIIISDINSLLKKQDK